MKWKPDNEFHEEVETIRRSGARLKSVAPRRIKGQLYDTGLVPFATGIAVFPIGENSEVYLEIPWGELDDFIKALKKIRRDLLSD